MGGILIQNGKAAFTDANSRPLAGGRVFFYQVGTQTPKDTYQDSALTILNTNPIILDARGEASIYGSGAYRQVVKDASLNQIWDQVIPDAVNGFLTDLSNTTDPTKGASLIPSVTRNVDNVATLRTMPKVNGSVTVRTRGYYAPGDGGGAEFYLDPLDTTSVDNLGTIIVASDGGRWKMLRTDNLNVLQFGAKADGTATTPTDNTVALAAAGAFNVSFPVGTYLTKTVTFTGQVTMALGAVIKAVGSSSVITFNGGFKAPVAQVFNLAPTATGGTDTPTVTFDFSKTYQGFAEWWGAVPNSATADCTPAFNAALVALREVGMLPVQYFVASTIKMQLDHRRLFGAGRNWTGSGGTQIISNSASATIIKMGLDANPGSVNANVQHLRLESFTTNRNVTALDTTATCAGIDSSWVLFGHIQDVENINSRRGIYYSGDVQVWSTRCYSFRILPGTVPANESTYGYLYNGVSGSPLAGGNASLYMRDCSSACALTATQSPTNIGFGCAGKPADLFFFGCEVASAQQGMFIDASNTIAGDCDIRIDNFVADGMGQDGIFIQNLKGTVRITNSYAAPIGTATGFTGLRAINSSGISEDGNQWICWPAANSCGVSLISCTNCYAGAGTVIRDAARPLEVHGCTSSEFRSSIINLTVACTQGAVLVDTTATRNEFAVAVNGAANMFAYGYRAPDSTPTYNKFDWTKINPVSLTSGASSKRLIYGSTEMGNTVGTLTNGNFSVGQAA